MKAAAVIHIREEWDLKSDSRDFGKLDRVWENEGISRRKVFKIMPIFWADTPEQYPLSNKEKKALPPLNMRADHGSTQIL